MSGRINIADLTDLATNGSDREWWDATGTCGGCGDEDCHDGPCTNDLDVCRNCGERVAEGWFR